MIVLGYSPIAAYSSPIRLRPQRAPAQVVLVRLGIAGLPPDERPLLTGRQRQPNLLCDRPPELRLKRQEGRSVSIESAGPDLNLVAGLHDGEPDLPVRALFADDTSTR